jgi:hypothetical protein
MRKRSFTCPSFLSRSMRETHLSSGIARVQTALPRLSCTAFTVPSAFKFRSALLARRVCSVSSRLSRVSSSFTAKIALAISRLAIGVEAVRSSSRMALVSSSRPNRTFRFWRGIKASGSLCTIPNVPRTRSKAPMSLQSSASRSRMFSASFYRSRGDIILDVPRREL